MVYDTHHTHGKPIEPLEGVPDPVDRFAAFAVDMFCVFVLSGVFLAPIQRSFREAQIMGRLEDIPWLVLAAVLVVGAVGTLYQGFSVGWKGHTLGKRLFGLRVVGLWNSEPLSLGSAFLRAMGFWFSVACMGFPFLAVWTDRRGRTLYDRLSDSRVVGMRRTWNPKATPSANIVRSVLAALILTVGIGVLVQIGSILRENDSDNTDLSELSHEECELVSQALESWDDQDPNRLEMALALFGAGVEKSDCLDSEANAAFSKGKDLELAYLAKAFARSEDADLSDEYLEKVCEKGSDSRACQFSRLVELWTQNKWQDADKIFQQLLPESPLYIKVWAVKHYEKMHKYDKELEILKAIGARRELNDFLGSRRITAYWGLYRRDDAHIALETILTSASKETQLSLSSWVCYRELLQSCEAAKDTVCETFERRVAEDEGVLENGPILAAHLRREECLSPLQVVFTDLVRNVKDEAVQELALAIEETRTGKMKKGKERLLQIAMNSKSERYLALEARKHLLVLPLDTNELSDLVENWQSTKAASWDWKHIGAELADTLMRRKRYQAAAEIAHTILEKDALHPDARQILVTSLANLGQRREAWRRSSELRSRQPASEQTYQTLLKSLEREFER